MLKSSQARQDEQISSLDVSQARQDEQISGLDANQIQQAQQINHLSTSQMRQDEQINALQADQGRQDSEIGALQADQGRQDSDISTLQADQGRQDSDISTLQADQGRQDSDISTLQADQGRQDSDISTLQADQGRQDSDISTLQADQARQDKLIMANSARLDQQAHVLNALKTHKTGRAQYNPWYVKGVARAVWSGSMDVDREEFGFKGDTDTGYGAGLAGGRRFGNFRVEGELAAQTADFTTEGLSDITVSTLMLNGFYHVPLPNFGIFGSSCNAFSIYGMAGMGAGKAEITLDNTEDSDTGFAYKVGAGIAYEFTRNMGMDLGYEYMRTAAVELGNEEHTLFNDVKTSSVNAAVRYSF
jgi:opacity protein-like surface antigen